MKKKILAALCAICTCGTSYTAAFLPTALAENTVGTFITYEPLQTDHTDNVFYVSEDVVFTMRCTNTYGSNVTTKYTYTVTDANNNVITGPIASNNITLQAGKSGTRTITLSGLACGEYTLELQEESGTSNSNKQTLKFYAQFTVIELPPTPSPVPGEEYITYETPYPEKGGSAYYSTEDVVYKVKVTNKLDQVVYGRYQYTLTKPDGTELPEVKQQGFSTLNAKASVTAAITIDVPEGVYGTYTLQLKYLSSLDKTIATAKTKIFDDITFTVNEPPASADLTKVTYGNWKASGSHPGNVFYGSEPVELTINIENTNNYPVYVRYSYEVEDEAGNSYTSSSAPSKPQVAGANTNADHTLELQAAKWKYGIYKVKLTAECATSEDSGSFTTLSVLYTKFSVCIPLRDGNANGGFGFNQAVVNAGRDYWDYADELVPLMKKAGARWHREDISWVGMEPNGGKQFTDLDKKGYKKRLEDLEAQGIQNVCILNGRNGSYCDSITIDGEQKICVPRTTPQIQAFGDFCENVATQLKGVVHYYEIWNEWNIQNFNPSEEGADVYVQLLEEAYTRIKAVDDTITVIGCDSAGMPYGQGQFIGQVLYYGGGQFMDAISVHCYYFNDAEDETPGFPEQKFRLNVNGLKSLLETYHISNKPIWLTETGFSTYTKTSASGDNPEGGNASPCTEEQQLNSIVMLGVANKNFGLFDNVIQYNFSDRDNNGIIDKTKTQLNYGILYNWKQDQGDQTTEDFIPRSCPKPAYLGLAAMNYFIGGDTEALEQIGNNGARRYAFKFKNKTLNKYVTVLIAGGFDNSQAETINIGSPSIDIYDKYGNYITTRESATGYYSLEVRPEPVYIVSGPKIEVKKNGQPVTSGRTLKRGDTLTVSMTGMSQHIKQATSPAMIVAQYDEKGKYLGSDMHKFSTQTDFSGTITVARFARKIKVIYWDMSGLKPLLDTYYIQ